MYWKLRYLNKKITLIFKSYKILWLHNETLDAKRQARSSLAFAQNWRHSCDVVCVANACKLHTTKFIVEWVGHVCLLASTFSLRTYFNQGSYFFEFKSYPFFVLFTPRKIYPKYYIVYQKALKFELNIYAKIEWKRKKRNFFIIRYIATHDLRKIKKIEMDVR